MDTQKKKKCKGFLYDSHHCEVGRKWHITAEQRRKGKRLMLQIIYKNINFSLYKNSIEFFGLAYLAIGGYVEIQHTWMQLFVFLKLRHEMGTLQFSLVFRVYVRYDIKVNVKINSAPVDATV